MATSAFPSCPCCGGRVEREDRLCVHCASRVVRRPKGRSGTPALPETVVRRDPLVPFLGRERELGILESAFARIGDGIPSFVTVVGDAGIGKSHLVSEFLHHAASCDGAAVLYGRPGAAALSAWAPVVGALAARYQAPASARATEGSLRALVPWKRPRPSPWSDSEVLDLVSGVPPKNAALRSALEGEAASGLRLCFPVVARLLHAVVDRPLIVVLTGLHAADAATLDLAEYLTAVLDDVPLLWVGQARPGLLEARPSWMAGRELHESCLLDALPETVAVALADRHLGGNAPAHVAERVARLAGGNPLVIRDLCRGSGAGLEGGLPGTIQEMIELRLEGLDPSLRPVVEAAAVLGEGAEAEALITVAGGDVPPSARISAVTGGLLRVRGDRGSIGFAVPLFEPHVLGKIPGDRRAEFHRRAASWFRQRGRIAEAARHAREAGDLEAAMELDLASAEAWIAEGKPGSALPPLERLLAEALGTATGRRASLLAAEACYKLGEPERALAHLAGSPLAEPERPEVVDLRVRCLEAAGRNPEALAQCRTAQRGASSVAPALDLRMTEAWLLLSMGSPLEAERAVRDAEATTDLEAEAYHNLLGAIEARKGRHVQAVEHFESSRTIAQRRHCLPAEAKALSNVSAALHEAGRFDESLRCAMQALAMEEALGDLGSVVLSYLNIANTALERFRYDQAQRLAEEAVRLGRRMGVGRIAGLGMLVLAEVALRLGNAPGALRKLDLAMPLIAMEPRHRAFGLSLQGAVLARLGIHALAARALDAAGALFMDLQDELSGTTVGLRWADLSLRQGDLARAVREAERCASRARALRRPELLAESLWLAAAGREREDPRAALGLLAAATRQASRAGQFEHLVRIRVRRARLLERLGRTRAAQACRGKAREAVSTILDGIKDPDIRRIYREQADIVSLLGGVVGEGGGVHG